MKLLIFPLLFVVTIAIPQDQPVQADRFHGQTTTSTRMSTKAKNTGDQPDDSACKGKPIVTLEDTLDDGSKVLEQVVHLDDGKDIKHGLTTSYWPDGSKRLEVEYVCGKLHGLRAAYYTDGSRRSVGEYLNGKEHGTWIEWYRNGKKSKRFSMDHGAWQGTFTVWYTNGQKRIEVTYVKGQRQGRLYSWNEKGNIIHQQDYVDNRPQPTPSP